MDLLHFFYTNCSKNGCGWRASLDTVTPEASDPGTGLGLRWSPLPARWAVSQRGRPVAPPYTSLCCLCLDLDPCSPPGPGGPATSHFARGVEQPSGHWRLRACSRCGSPEEARGPEGCSLLTAEPGTRTLFQGFGVSSRDLFSSSKGSREPSSPLTPTL